MRIASIVYCTLFIMVNSRKIQRRTKGKHRGIEFAKKRITNARDTGSCSYGGIESCSGEDACFGPSIGDIGENSCIGKWACALSTGNIGDDSCRGQDSCYGVHGTIGSNSCIGDYSCQDHQGDIPSNCPSVEALNAGHCMPGISPLVDLSTVVMNLCQGNCNKDDECNDDLVCYFRNGITPIPGCLGDGTADYNYCVDFESIPSYTDLTAVLMNPTHTLGQCEGDCDDDDDCAGVLVCHQRDGIAVIPGCQGDGVPHYDYCTSE